MQPVPGIALRIVALFLLLLTTTGADRQVTPGDERSTSVRARYLMGTRLVIECSGEVDPPALEAALDEVARLEEILSNWRAASELSRLNREGADRPVPVSPELMQAIESSLGWAERTAGAFDPTVESLVRRYGIRQGMASAEDDALRGADTSGVAPDGEHGALHAVVGWRHVTVDREARTVHLTRDGIGIDLGGIGKGIALDRAAEVLAARGVGAGLLDFGGQVLAIGKAPDEGWPIGVADPDDRRRSVAVVNLRTGSLATSGNSERAVIGEEGTLGHILDPRLGTVAPFTGSVTVRAADGTTADALSTALFVMGPDRGLEWAESRGIAALYIWREDGRRFEFRATSAMRSSIDNVPVARRAARGN